MSPVWAVPGVFVPTYTVVLPPDPVPVVPPVPGPDPPASLASPEPLRPPLPSRPPELVATSGALASPEPLRPPLAPPVPGAPPLELPPEPLRPPVPLAPPVPGWPPVPLAPPVPGWPPELVAPPVPVWPPDPCTPPLPLVTDVLDEQAALAIASAATVVRKKQLDVMRSSPFGISTVGVCQGAPSRPQGLRECKRPGHIPSYSTVEGAPEFRLEIQTEMANPAPVAQWAARLPVASADTTRWPRTSCRPSTGSRQYHSGGRRRC
jgi:hypothetical protein